MTMSTSRDLAPKAVRSIAASAKLPSPRGLEGATGEDLVFPRYQLVQDGPNSALIKQGYKPGKFINSLTGVECDNFDFVPIKMTKYVDLLRKEGAKMVFDHRVFDMASPELQGRQYFPDYAKDVKANAVSVIAFSGLVDGMPAMLNFKKTSHDTGKQLVTMIQFSKKDAWTTTYKIGSKSATNKRGEGYFVITVAANGDTAPELLSQAEYYYGVFGGKSADALVGGADEEQAPF